MSSISSAEFINARPVNFVLLGHQRCGSNLLLRALTEHPQIRMLGEVMASDPKTRKMAWAWTAPEFDGYQSGHDGGEFLERTVFGSPPLENLRAFGFKLFYDQARFDEFSQTAWDYILGHDVRIVHLIRRNLFYALISLEVAERTNRWHQAIEQAGQQFPDLPPFELDPARCRAYFDSITEWRTSVLKEFSAKDVLTIDYENNLCKEFRETAFRVFRFLGTIPWHVRPGMIKQQTVTASRQIANFDDLRGYFRHTPYQEFFENGDSPDGIRPATLTRISFR